MIPIDDHLAIPDEDVTFATSRSGGPGGQNVNKLETRVTLRFDLAGSGALSEEQKLRLRERLATLHPVASAKVANRLIEAHERKYWSPDPEMLDVLRRAGEELEDRLEGVGVAA